MDDGFKYMHFTIQNPNRIKYEITFEKVDGTILTIEDMFVGSEND